MQYPAGHGSNSPFWGPEKRREDTWGGLFVNGSPSLIFRQVACHSGMRYTPKVRGRRGRRGEWSHGDLRGKGQKLPRAWGEAEAHLGDGARTRGRTCPVSLSPAATWTGSPLATEPLTPQGTLLRGPGC